MITEIQIFDNGPLMVKGEVTLNDGEGKSYTVETDNIALCRCGHSGNKPFCDGSHKRVGFESQCRAG
jgi:CDGSH-type Zn-finger protein